MENSRLKKTFLYLCLGYVVLSPLLKPKLGGKISPPDLLFLLLLVAFAALIIREKPWKLARGYLILFLVILAEMLLDLAFTGNYLKGLVRIAGQGYLFTVFLVFYYFAQSRLELDRVFYAWFITGTAIAFSCLAGFVLYYLGFHGVWGIFVGIISMQVQTSFPRLGGFVESPYLSHFLIGVILILFYFHLQKIWKFGNYAVFLTLFSLLFIADFLTIDRSFFCWVIPLAAITMIFRKPNDPLRLAVGVAIIVAALSTLFILTWWNIFPVQINHDADSQELKISVSLKPAYPRRAVYYPSVWREIKKSPVWGRGPGHMATGPVHVVVWDYTEGAYAHNIILETWSTRGIFGMILYMLFWIMLVVNPLLKFRGSQMPEQAKWLLGIAVGMMIVGFTVDIEDWRHMYIIFGLLAGYPGPRASG